MTNKELIELLKKLPQNEAVYVATAKPIKGSNRFNIINIQTGSLGIYLKINI